MIFYDGIAHKIDDVEFVIPEDDYCKPWKFTSSDGRFEMDFLPILDRSACLDYKLIVSDQHQVFGRIPDIIERFKNLDKEIDRKRTDKSFMVPKQDIVDNSYDLSINKYKEIEYVPVEYPSTIEIMTNIREIEMEIGKEMEELEKLLGE